MNIRFSSLHWFRMKFIVLKHLTEFGFKMVLVFLPCFIHLTVRNACFCSLKLEGGRGWLICFLLRIGLRSWLLTVSFKWPFFRDCDLTLLKPLWQLFTHMENNLCHDVTKPGILLPLHRALAELFFVTENRVTVSSSFIYLSPLPSAGNVM